MEKLIQAVMFIDRYLKPQFDELTYIIGSNFKYFWCNEFVEYLLYKNDQDKLRFRKSNVEVYDQEIFDIEVPSTYEAFEQLLKEKDIIPVL